MTEMQPFEYHKIGGVYRLAPECIIPSITDIVGKIGYPSSKEVSAKELSVIDDLRAEAITLSKPIAIVRFCDFKLTDRILIKISNGPVFHAKQIADSLKDAEKLALFTLSLGKEISHRIFELSQESILGGYILDIIASSMVESAADALQDAIVERAKPTIVYHTLRFSPGYCYWSVRETEPLLSYIDAKRIGITLTEGGMMVPAKSICGMIGFSRDPDAVSLNPCITCTRDDCTHRR